MRLYITGIRGQLGSYLAGQAAHSHEVVGSDLPQFDIAQHDQVDAALRKIKPDLVLHCAAFTNVDAAAERPDLAYRTNAQGTQNVASVCARLGVPMVYISTNEVFDGTASEPYRESDAPNPPNSYGQSKLAGEHFTRQLLARHYVVRTSWLTGAGGRNFVHRIQKLADERGTLRVVTDEIACPTFVPDLAEALLKLIVTERYGIYHFVNTGYCSRYDFARAILDRSGRRHIPIEPITLADYARPSSPPKFSALANACGAALGITLRPWQAALEAFLTG